MRRLKRAGASRHKLLLDFFYLFLYLIDGCLFLGEFFAYLVYLVEVAEELLSDRVAIGATLARDVILDALLLPLDIFFVDLVILY